MGQKTNPLGFRLGITKDWKAFWFAPKKEIPYILFEDLQIRNKIDSLGRDVAISSVEIYRKGEQVRVLIFSARPGVLIGKGGANIEILRNELQDIVGNKKLDLKVVEVKKPEISAKLQAEFIADRIEKRASYKRAMKQTIARSIKGGAKGIKVQCSGRLDGAEIARTEWFKEGRVPLQTLTADIDYAYIPALTKFGIIGVRVWIYRGELSVRKSNKEEVEV
ncbi:MAG TPA: 30S ribosomal protein S3 [Caldisericia bacterium]|nr:30S ribosomal protein S3 [Caldisericia bacterium]HOL82644.1 30S ribosomal protein S3 [Caldisericia bacterium]HON83315.1 30S ribosomal protein S3 [Caldisericia bacterium]HPC56509.1 30S ribosomal protein S3 [Caldisericia bacterium]HPP43316.1 30S ribosomal protein S3 [Caldisericia bacterium]